MINKRNIFLVHNEKLLLMKTNPYFMDFIYKKFYKG